MNSLVMGASCISVIATMVSLGLFLVLGCRGSVPRESDFVVGANVRFWPKADTQPALIHATFLLTELLTDGQGCMPHRD